MLQEILHNTTYTIAIMAVIVFFLTQLIKLPIKFLTGKINNAKYKRIANGIILLLPFLLGILGMYLYSKYYLLIAFDPIKGLSVGTASITLYNFVERFFNVKVENPYETESGKKVIELVDKISSDGKIDTEDIDSIKSAYEDFEKSL